MSKPATIPVPVEVTSHDDTHMHTRYVARVAGTRSYGLCTTSEYSTSAKARNQLRANVMAALTNEDARDRDPARTVVVCGDGTVLCVERGGYSVSGRDRRTSWCMNAATSHDAMLASAREHAAQSYGGIAWEARL